MASSSTIASLRRSVLVTSNKKFLHQKFQLPTSGLPSFSFRSFSDRRYRYDDKDNDSCPVGSYPVYKFGDVEKHHSGEDGLTINLDLVGLEKKDVKVYYKKFTELLVEEIPRNPTGKVRSIYRTSLKENQYKTDEISLDMKKGMLSIFLPNNMNEEEIKNLEGNVKNLLGNGHDTTTPIADHSAPGDDEHVENGIAKIVKISDLVSLDSATSSLFSGKCNELYPRRIIGDHWMAENEDGVFLSINLPGLGKEDVEATLETAHKMLTIKEKKIVSDNEEENNDVGKDKREKKVPYTRCFRLPKVNAYDKDQVTAEMKNGLLRVFVLKQNLEKIDVEVKGE